MTKLSIAIPLVQLLVREKALENYIRGTLAPAYGQNAAYHEALTKDLFKKAEERLRQSGDTNPWPDGTTHLILHIEEGKAPKAGVATFGNTVTA